MEQHNREWYENYAKEHNLVLGEKADKVIEAVNKSEGFCPCKVALWKKTRPDELLKIVCPCEEHMAEIEKMGRCTCCLFYRKED